MIVFGYNGHINYTSGHDSNLNYHVVIETLNSSWYNKKSFGKTKVLNPSWRIVGVPM